MQRYVKQLLEDIDHAGENVEWPYQDRHDGIVDWMPDEEEEKTAPRRPLEEWTGIKKIQLPPDDRLDDEDLSPEEERARHLEIEIDHIKGKYGEDWKKYYPYHLDTEYDDEDGNPYDYGFRPPDESDPADWWRGE